MGADIPKVGPHQSPYENGALVTQRPTIDLRHMTMHTGASRDTSTGRKFHNVDDANKAIRDIAVANRHAFDGVVIERDTNSPIDRALIVVIYWGLSTEIYHLHTVDHAPANAT